MKSYLNTLEETILRISKDAVDINSGGGDLALSVKAITSLKDDYETPVLYEIPDQYSVIFREIAVFKGTEQAIAFAEKHGVKLPDEDVKIWSAGIMLQHQGQTELAQAMYDAVYANNLRRKLYYRIEPKLQDKFVKANLQEIAKKTRNPHRDSALKIAKATWQKYPGASLGQMCEKIRSYFNNEISIDTLKRGIKSAGIRPKSPKERKSFSLVIPPEA